MAEEWFFVLGALGIAAAALIIALLIRSGTPRNPGPPMVAIPARSGFRLTAAAIAAVVVTAVAATDVAQNAV